MLFSIHCNAHQWMSPYSYCGANPIVKVDIDGERPTANEAALMAAIVYETNGKYRDILIKGLTNSHWHISPFNTSIQKNYTQWYQNGLQSELFQRTVNGVTEYAYVYAGTNSVEDVLEDIVQVNGYAPQYATAINNARILSKELNSNELTFVGHSLGGGEAIAASMATGRAAITFNPAAVSLCTKISNSLLFKSTDNIVNYKTTGEKFGINFNGDIVHYMQKCIGLNAQGQTINIPMNGFPPHGIKNFLNINLPEP